MVSVECDQGAFRLELTFSPPSDTWHLISIHKLLKTGTYLIIKIT